MDIGIITDTCKVAFDNADVAIAYVLALAGQMLPEQFVQTAAKIMHFAPAGADIENLRKMAEHCLGSNA